MLLGDGARACLAGTEMANAIAEGDARERRARRENCNAVGPVHQLSPPWFLVLMLRRLPV